VIKSLIQLAARTSVQPERDGWFGPRDQSLRADTGGSAWWTNGVDGRLPVGAVYAIVAGLLVASAIVNVFSAARDISWRLGSPQNLWEPALWNVTSTLVALVLLPLIRRGALRFRGDIKRPLTAAAGFLALAFLYSALHIAGMGLLRELAYGLAGWTYNFPWSGQILYELRKDLFGYLALAVIFWFAERPIHAAPVRVDEVAPALTEDTAAKPELWLRDGRVSVLIDPGDIIFVTSAGNYVEYELTDRRKYLIRATLQAEQTRLAPFGIARVHRSRLLNLKRIVALEWGASGDFKARVDTGETVLGSRRFKAVVADLLPDRSPRG
jgi:LytTr DNA-binding domain